MASIFKKSRDKGRKNKPWWIEYVDADGNRAYAKGFTDKGLTEQLAAKLESEAMLRQRRMIDPAQERLLAIQQSPIGDHLAAFERSLENATPKHRKLTMTRVRRLVKGCGFATLGEMDAEQVEECLKAIRSEEDLGARTYNHYLQAIDEFGKWLAASKRLNANPVAGIERLNSETDIRHKRRALTPEEVSRLVQSARESGRVIQGYDGELRARAYITSFFTGLRRQELGSLTPRSFRLDNAQPILTVAAACSKHRREDTLPVHPDLADMVREWVGGMGPDDLLFPRIERKKTWLMVKLDLERVGIAYETYEGIADFHAAGRHSHITGLLRNGATLVEARQLARHADVRMTMKYTHIGLEDQASALAGLPLPKASTNANGSGIGRVLGGALGQELASAGSDAEAADETANEKPPSGEGVMSFPVTASQELAFDVSSGGGGNCTRVPKSTKSRETKTYDNRITGTDWHTSSDGSERRKSGPPSCRPLSEWIKKKEQEATANGSITKLEDGPTRPGGEVLLIDIDAVAHLLRVSKTTLWRLRVAGHLPRPIRIGSLIRWRVAEVRSWMDDGCPQVEKRRRSLSEA